MKLSQKGKTERKREKNNSVFLVILMSCSITEIALFFNKMSEGCSRVIDIYCGEVSTADCLGTVADSIVGKIKAKLQKCLSALKRKHNTHRNTYVIRKVSKAEELMRGMRNLFKICLNGLHGR